MKDIIKELPNYDVYLSKRMRSVREGPYHFTLIIDRKERFIAIGLDSVIRQSATNDAKELLISKKHSRTGEGRLALFGTFIPASSTLLVHFSNLIRRAGAKFKYSDKVKEGLNIKITAAARALAHHPVFGNYKIAYDPVVFNPKQELAHDGKTLREVLAQHKE